MAHRMTWLLVLAIAVAPACRQVLGLEDAKLEEANGAAGSPPVTNKNLGFYCELPPVKACEECLEACGGFAGTCASDFECVSALRTYDTCIGPSCAKGDAVQQESCVSALPPEQLKCPARCLDKCGGTKLVSDCVLYCACMQAECASEPSADCMTECGKKQPELINCQLKHCTFAGQLVDEQERTKHCRHASGAMDICASSVGLSQSERRVCLDKNANFWPCKRSSDCCSEKCTASTCSP